jgi:ATP adenylyltransferase
VCLNRYPFAAGHLLVAPTRHAGDPADFDADDYHAFMDLVREAGIRLRRAVGCEGLNLGVNVGDVAGAGVPGHLHAHVVPRWRGDTNFMPVIADVRVMPQYLDDTYQHLFPHFADLA